MTKQELFNNVIYKLVEDHKAALFERVKIPCRKISGYIVTYNYRIPGLEKYSLIITDDELRTLGITQSELDDAARRNTNSAIVAFIDMVERLENSDYIAAC